MDMTRHSMTSFGTLVLISFGAHISISEKKSACVPHPALETNEQ